LRLPNTIKVERQNWVRMMFCIKHLMKLHPEYNEMIMPFYSQMYELHPYNEDDPFDFGDEDNVISKEEFNKQLDQLIWDLGLSLPSWDDNDNRD